MTQSFGGEPSIPQGFLPQSASSSEFSHDQPQSQNLNYLDQTIQDTISKVTSQFPQSNFIPSQVASSTFQAHQIPQFQFSTSLGYPDHFNTSSCQSLNHPNPNPHQIKSIPFSKPTPSTNPDAKRLPQDILHILESDFTSITSDEYGGKDKEIKRVAEELRVQARLSRYQRARDQLADSEDENSLHEEEDSDGSNSESSNGEQDVVNERDDMDQVDGSGDEDTERIKNNEALAKLKVEIEQIIGIPEHSLTSNLIGSDNAAPTVKPEEEPTKNETQFKHEFDEGSQADPVDPVENAVNLSPKPEPDSQVHVSTNIVSSEAKNCTTDQPASKDDMKSTEPSSPQVKKSCKKPTSKPQLINRDDFSDESDIEECDTFAGPKTVHELKEPPPEVIQVPFTRVSEVEMKTISPFGVISSLIGNVLVIKSASSMGYDRVLDEGTLVCCKNGLVVGKIFETFGSVINPHYSIRLPSHASGDDDLNLSPGTELYYIPTHSKFVFTSELRSQPKGTDASNLFDEEVDHTEEIEFSDDEAEAAYLKACKLARKASKQSKNNPSQGQRQRNSNPDSFHLTEEGIKMFVKQRPGQLNEEDGINSRIETDYNLLARSKGVRDGCNNLSFTSISTNSNNRPATNPRSNKGRKRGGAKNRDQIKNSSQQHHKSSYPQVDHSSTVLIPSFNQTSNTGTNGNTDSMFQFGQQTNSMVPLSSNPYSTKPQAPVNTSTMMTAQAQGDSTIVTHSSYQGNQNINPPTFWHPSTDSTGVINNHVSTMMDPLQTGIPCYNPLMPSINPNFPSNFGFGFPSFNNHHLMNAHPNPLAPHQPIQQSTWSNNHNFSSPSFNLVYNQPDPNQPTGHFNPNFSNFNPQFFRPP